MIYNPLVSSTNYTNFTALNKTEKQLRFKWITNAQMLLLTLQETLFDATFTLFFQSHTFTIISC